MTSEGLRVQKVIRNIASVASARLISQVLLAITGIMLIRYLGLKRYSEYSTAMLFMGMFSLLGRVGFNQVFLREGSRYPEMASKYYGAVFFITTSIVSVALSIAIIISYYRYDTNVFLLCLLLGFSQTLMCLRRTSITVFQIQQKLHYSAIVSVIGAAFYAITFSTAVYYKTHVYVFAALHLLMNFLVICLSFGLSFRLLIPRLEWTIVRKVFSIGKRFFVIDTMNALYAQASGFILAALDLGDQVGIYNAPMRLFLLFDMMLYVIATAISPAIYGASFERERIIRGLMLTVKYFTVNAVLVGIILIGRAEWIMISVFKSDFAASGNILKIFGLAIIFRFMTAIFIHVIYSQDKEHFMMKVTSGFAIFSVFACLILALFYGALGVALVFLFCEICVGIICLLTVENLLMNPRVYKLYLHPALIGCLCLFLLSFTESSPVLGMLAAIVLFYLGLLFTKYYKTSEILSLIKLAIK